MPGVDIGDAYVQIVPSARGIKQNVQNLLDGSGIAESGEKTGGKLGSALLTGAKVTMAASAAALGVIIKQGLEAGGALEQSFGGLDTIYGEASAQAKEFAMQAAQAGISANTYAEQAVGMGAALKAAFGGDTAKAAEAANTAIMDMADNAAKMGTPIENLQNAYQGFAKGNYTMLDNLKLGYGGTQKEMERLLADAEKFSGVKYDINNLGDVYAAIHVIQSELGLTGVAASEASTTLQGSAGAMKASWENLMAAMTTGEGLEQAMANMGTSVGAFADNVIRMLGTLMKQMPTLIQGLAKQALAKAPEFIASGLELMVKLAVGVVQGIPKVIAKLPEIFRRVKSSFAGYDWGALGKELVSGLVAGLKDMGEAVWNAIKSALSGLGSSIWSWIKELIRGSAPGGGGGDGGDTGGTPAGNGVRKNGSVPSRLAGNAAALGNAKKAQSNSFSPADLAAALKDLRVETVVVLDGDAGRMLKVVNKSNYANTVRTGKNLLAAKG